MLEIASVDKLSVLVNSNYVGGSKLCPTLTWELSTKHDFAPSVDKLGRDVVTVYSHAKLRANGPAPTTVTAYGPNGMTASIDIVIP